MDRGGLSVPFSGCSDQSLASGSRPVFVVNDPEPTVLQRNCRGASGQRLTILAIKQRAHRLSPSLVCFTHCLALIRVHGAPSRRGTWFRSAARRAAVGETGLVRFQFEL